MQPTLPISIPDTPPRNLPSAVSVFNRVLDLHLSHGYTPEEANARAWAEWFAGEVSK